MGRGLQAAVLGCVASLALDASAQPVPGPAPEWAVEVHSDPALLPAPPLPAQATSLSGVFDDRNGKSYLVGRSAELYEATGRGEWVRTGVGGVSTDVWRVYRNKSGALYAAGSRAPLFKFDGHVWSAAPLVNKGPAAASTGPAPVIAIRRHLYSLGDTGWAHQGTTPGPLRRIWAASLKKIYALTSKGTLMVRQNRFWRSLNVPLAADDSVVELAGIPKKIVVAITAKGQLIELSGTRVQKLARAPELEGLEIHCVGTAQGQLWVAGQLISDGQKRPVLARLENKRLIPAASLWALTEGDRFAILHQTQDQSLLVASQRGQLRLMNQEGAWSNGVLHAQPPGPGHPSAAAAPARSF